MKSYSSVTRSILHSEGLPIWVSLYFSSSEDEGTEQELDSNSETQELNLESDDTSYSTNESLTPQQFIQPELNDFVRGLGVPKNAAEVSAPRQASRNNLKQSAKSFFFPTANQIFVFFFRREEVW